MPKKSIEFSVRVVETSDRGSETWTKKLPAPRVDRFSARIDPAYRYLSDIGVAPVPGSSDTFSNEAGTVLAQVNDLDETELRLLQDRFAVEQRAAKLGFSNKWRPMPEYRVCARTVSPQFQSPVAGGLMRLVSGILFAVIAFLLYQHTEFFPGDFAPWCALLFVALTLVSVAALIHQLARYPAWLTLRESFLRRHEPVPHYLKLWV